MYDVVIVGAGISGLSLAYRLYRGGVERILVVEKAHRVGGKLRTVLEDGFVVEAGPNGFLDNKPFALELAEELGISHRLYPSSEHARHRYLLVDGVLREIPVTPAAFLKTSLLSWKGKLRVLLEPFVGKGRDEDETVADFVKRRLGGEFVERFIDPMVAGIFAGSPYELSVKAAFPAVWRLEREHGSLIRGMLFLAFKRGRAEAGPAGRLVSFVNGVEELPKALFSFLKDRIEFITGTDVKATRVEHGWVVETVNGSLFSKAIALCVPAHAVGEVLEGMDHVVGLSSRIPYAPISVVALGYRKEDVSHNLEGFGFLVPSSEKGRILGCLWDSSIFPNRAPEGKVLLRAMVGGARQPKLATLEEKELVGLVLDELGAVLGLKGDPVKVWVFRYEKGILQYVLGHWGIVRRLEELGGSVGLFFHSNAYRGVGFNDCIGASAKVCDTIREYLGRA